MDSVAFVDLGEPGGQGNAVTGVHGNISADANERTDDRLMRRALSCRAIARTALVLRVAAGFRAP